MKSINRRTFVQGSVTAAVALTTKSLATFGSSHSLPARTNQKAAPSLVDTNINLLNWPFRELKYGTTDTLVEKLKKHNISQAWAGSFESLFHKNIDAVNERLTKECMEKGAGMLLPFGTVNIAWADWREDLRRCQELYGMQGIKIFPSYQTFDFTHPDFISLLEEIAKRGMILQIVGDMDDSRNVHPVVKIREVNYESLIDVAKSVTDAKIQLIYWNQKVTGKVQNRFVKETSVFFDTSRIEGNGGLGRLIGGTPWNGVLDPVPDDRILFGSHVPFFPIENNLLKLFESPLTEGQFMNVARRTANGLLKKN